MKKLRLSIGFLALVAVTFLFSTPGVFGRDMSCEDTPECGQPPEPPYDEGVDRTQSKREHWRGGGYNIDEIFEAASSFFNVDKKVVQDTEKFLRENHMCEDICSKDAVKLVILARFRANNLIESGQVPKDMDDRKLMEESVKYIQDRRKKQYVASELAAGRKTQQGDKFRGGYGDITADVGISPKLYIMMGKTFFNCLNCWYTDKPIIEDLEKQGFSHEDAIKIYILAKFASDRIIGGSLPWEGEPKQFSRIREFEAIREAAKYYVYKRLEKNE